MAVLVHEQTARAQPRHEDKEPQRQPLAPLPLRDNGPVEHAAWRIAMGQRNHEARRALDSAPRELRGRKHHAPHGRAGVARIEPLRQRRNLSAARRVPHDASRPSLVNAL